MIAEVYPLMRLPRIKQAFDYIVPDSVPLKRGNFVQIPYRSKLIWGIVKRVKDKPPRGIILKQLQSVSDVISLREEELSFFENISKLLVQSPASLLHASVPTPPKRATKSTYKSISWLPLTLPRSEADHVVRIVQTIEMRGKSFIQTPDLRRSAAVLLGFLQKNTEQKVLVLVPTVADVHRLRGHLTGFTPHVITGEESNNERFFAWKAFRDQQTGILLGTRTALLAVDASITSIFAFRSGDKNYTQIDRNPRFDARELIWKYQEMFATKIIFCDVAPVPETISRFNENERISWGIYPSVQIANINQEKNASGSQFISYTALNSISNAISKGQQVLCVYNKKGHGRDLRCQDCSFCFTCFKCNTPLVALSYTQECPRCRHREPIALRCTSCHGTNLRSSNPGNLEIANELTRLFPHSTVQVIDNNHTQAPDAQIIVTTTYYYETFFDPFRTKLFGAIVHLSVDNPLYDVKPTAIEDLERDIWQWAWFSFACKSEIVLQSASIDLVSSCIENPFGTAKEELLARQIFELPPYYKWFRIILKDHEKRSAEIAIQKLFDQISIIGDTKIHPIYWTKENYPTIDCGILAGHEEALLSIFSSLSDQYIIDTNVFS